MSDNHIMASHDEMLGAEADSAIPTTPAPSLGRVASSEDIVQGNASYSTPLPQAIAGPSEPTTPRPDIDDRIQQNQPSAVTKLSREDRKLIEANVHKRFANDMSKAFSLQARSSNSELLIQTTRASASTQSSGTLNPGTSSQRGGGRLRSPGPAQHGTTDTPEELEHQASSILARQQPVVYLARNKTSRQDYDWDARGISEAEYDNLQVEGANAVLELRKDGHFTQQSLASGNLKFSKLDDESMVIYSQELISIMPQIVGYYPSSKSSGSELDGKQKLTINRPYRMLGGGLPRLKEIKETLEAEQEQHGLDERRARTIEHIGYLEHELNKVLKTLIAQEEDKHKRGFATFDMLWLIFRPGQRVYTMIHGEWACCVIFTPLWSRLVAEADGPARTTLVLRMWFLDFKGEYIDRRLHSVNIHEYAGEREILDLEVVPENFVSQDFQQHREELIRRKEELTRRREELITRGKKYIKYITMASPQCQYSGYVYEKQNKDKTMAQRHHYNGRAVVDPVFHAREYGSPDFGSIAWLDQSDIWPTITSQSDMSKYVNIDPKQENSNLTDEQYILFGPYIRGLTVLTRRWVWLHIDHLTDYSPNKEMIDYLQLDLEVKNQIKLFTPKILRQKRSETREMQSISVEPVAGKGEGRILLLHGPPGTGKTFTAECMAENSGRPLLRLSSTELGIDPVKLEERLWKWFRMAEEWQGIILIDEADVYLRQRGRDLDLERETLVVGFLKAVEFYKGILFLTTNIVKKFDDALLSRISLNVELPIFTRDQRKNLRQAHLIKISKDGKFSMDSGAMDKLEKMDEKDVYNGREITQVVTQVLWFATQDHKTQGRSGQIQVRDRHVGSVMAALEKFSKDQHHPADREKSAKKDGRR